MAATEVNCVSARYFNLAENCEGNLGFAWAFLRDTGITTDACFPYTAGNGTAAACQTTCVDGSSMTYYKSQDLYSLGSETDIMMDIMKNGPVEAGFSVYK